MAPKPDDPDCIDLEALARLLLHDAETDWSLIRRSHPARARHQRNDETQLPLVGREHRAKPPPEPLVLRQPEGKTDTATASAARSDDAARSVASGKRRLQLSRSQAWATTQPRQVRQGAPRGRRALVAGVAVVLLALMANRLSHLGSHSERAVQVVAKSDAPVAARGDVRSDGLALATPSVPMVARTAPIAPKPDARVAAGGNARHEAPAAPTAARTAPVAPKPDASVAARGSVQPEALALAAPTASAAASIAPVAAPIAPAAASPAPQIAGPIAVQSPEASHSIGGMPERAELTGQGTEPAHTAKPFAKQWPEQQNLQSQASQPSDQAGEASRRVDPRHEPIAQPEGRMTAESRQSGGTSRAVIASVPAREPRPDTAARSARARPSVPQWLLLARTALVNRDQRAARGLMEEAQTLITFQPANAWPRLSVGAASQVTEVLILLSRGDDAGALQRLNQLIDALRRTS
jgi:hypothetical protein